LGADVVELGATLVSLTEREVACVGVVCSGGDMQDLDFDEVVALIRKEDARYDRQAYHFIRAGLDHTVKARRTREGEARPKGTAHVSGQELLEGLRAYALDQFGPLARTVLEAWGVKRCGDFGEVVFNLIDYNVFSKTAGDRREDFAEFYTFEEAFEAPFRPTAAQRRTRSGAGLASSN
jgi:uncharacterized repeat protein (TIGR04138 family)